MSTHTPIDKPLFFEQLSAFQKSLPPSPHFINNHPSSPTPLLDNYLSYYGLDTSTLTTPYEHAIWQSNIQPQHARCTYTIVQQCWRPSRIRGTIVIVHGYLDHIGFYGRIIKWALAHDYCVLGFDLPGHGLSSGERAAINQFSDYSDIIKHVINKHLLHTSAQTPLYAIGQSTGCAVICDALLNKYGADNTPHFDQVILLAPLVRIHGWPLLRWLYRALKPFILSVKRSFIACSHDTAFNQFQHYQDPLQAKRIPLRWLGAMDAWYKHIQKTTITHPQTMTIIQGTGDMTVDWKYNLAQLKQRFPNSQAKLLKQAKHHLVKESDTYWQPVEEVIADLLQ
jgi:alpha-beta hydrolase superfamily lysophospholipase